jgi:hypothetical protein
MSICPLSFGNLQAITVRPFQPSISDLIRSSATVVLGVSFHFDEAALSDGFCRAGSGGIPDKITQDEELYA